MTIRLPGIGDILMDKLPQLADHIHGILNPYSDIEKQLQDNIAKDPTYLDKLAVANQNNPDQFKKMFGPKVQAYLNQVKPSQGAQNKATLDVKIGQQLATPGVGEDAASHQLTGQTVAGRTIEQGKAVEAKNDAEATALGDKYSALSPEEVWKVFEVGGPAAMGDLFTNPKTQAHAKYIEMKLNQQRQQLDWEKTMLLEEGRDKRNDARIAGEQKKLEQREKELNEKQIALNDISVNKFVVSQSAKKRPSKDEIIAQIPQVNELLQRNQVMRGLPAETAPQFVFDDSSWIKRGKVQLLNPDGSPNATYDAASGRTTTTPRPGTGTMPQEQGSKRLKVSNQYSVEKDPVVKRFADVIVKNNVDLDTLKRDPEYQKLSESQKVRVVASIDWTSKQSSTEKGMKGSAK